MRLEKETEATARALMRRHGRISAAGSLGTVCRLESDDDPLRVGTGCDSPGHPGRGS